MEFRRLIWGTFSGLRKSAGLLLVLAAIGGVAQAGGPVPTPEIDPGSMAGALTLLVGGVLLYADRFRRK